MRARARMYTRIRYTCIHTHTSMTYICVIYKLAYTYLHKYVYIIEDLGGRCQVELTCFCK